MTAVLRPRPRRVCVRSLPVSGAVTWSLVSGCVWPRVVVSTSPYVCSLPYHWSTTSRGTGRWRLTRGGGPAKLRRADTLTTSHRPTKSFASSPSALHISLSVRYLFIGQHYYYYFDHRDISLSVFSRPYLVRSRLCYGVASVCLSSVTLCIVAKRCVLEQKLLLAGYRKSYMRNRLVPK